MLNFVLFLKKLIELNIMANVVLITKNENLKNGFKNLNTKFFEFYSEEIFEEKFDAVVLDYEIENSKIILMELTTKNLTKEYEIFVLCDKNHFNECKKSGVRAFIQPVDFDFLENEINLSYENKCATKNILKENLELKKNLYQIDALYGASSKFAGTLDKTKLCEVMFETLERILSFDIASGLFRENIKCEKLKFQIRSIKKTDEKTNSNLIKRLALSAKNEGLLNIRPDRCEIETTIETKASYKNEFYNADLIDFDSLTAPIVIKDKFEGIIEIFRKTPFTKEDTTCFQAVVHQVLAPLRSAIYTDEIISANLELTKLEKIKSEFVSIVSHELRTPLTPINNALNIILSEEGGAIGEVNKNFALMAKRNVSRLSGIIEDLLDLSRMQTGKFDFKFKKSPIYNSLELAYNTFKNQAQEKKINFTFNTENNLPDVYIDPHRIDQILSNLITNALKFTKENGSISISAKLISCVDKEILINPAIKNFDGKFIQISIQDTGIGIEEEDIPKIFDKFSQIENSLSRTTGGIGLGLTITKYFIDTHLGGIFVNSVKNEGSTFNVLLPVYTECGAFETELNLKIKNEQNTAFFAIEEKGQEAEFYDYLKKANILKLTQNSKEVTTRLNNKCTTKVFIPEIDKNVYDFVSSAIEQEINKKEKKCDIVLTKAFYKSKKD